jgi:hypothetical protein
MKKFKKLKKLADGGYTTDDSSEDPILTKNGLQINGVGAAARAAYNNMPNQDSGPAPIAMGGPQITTTGNNTNYTWSNPAPLGDGTGTTPATTPIAGTPQPPRGGRNYGATAAQIAPFVSNIVNTFRTPAAVPDPHLNSPINLQKANYNNDRYGVETGARAMYQNADRTLDENTAQRVKQYALAQRFNQLSSVNQNERNQNVGITNQERQINEGITASNNAKLDERDAEKVQRMNAMQGQQSANLANASDKFIEEQNQGQKRDLDTKKLAVISDMYNKDGVAGRKWASLSSMKADPAGLQLLDNSKNTGMNEQQIFDAQDKAYQDRRAGEVKDLLTNYQRYGGAMKYSTGGMIKMFSKGGGININPANKGKFTALADSHGKSVQGMASAVMAHKGNYSSTIVKRANFAKNAAGWNH